MNPILKKTLEMMTEEVGLPGAVVALFDGDDITMFETYGLADKESGRKITENCSFDIASCSKAFTMMLAAQAVDEGLIGWDQPIRDVFPEFGMEDPYAGAHLSIRDIACHRTGLACHDFMRQKVGTSREHISLKSKDLGMNRGFRAGYEYNNHMFIVLGYVLERIFGKTWEELVTERIAGPLGITDIRFRGPNGWREGLERALPYACTGNGSVLCGYADNAFSGPCGGIKLTMPNLLKWVTAMAKGGVCKDGTRLCSKEQYEQMVTPLIPSVDGNFHKLQGSSYAMAWHTAVYNNQPIVYHSGELEGFNTEVGFLSNEPRGFAILFNNGGNNASKVMRAMMLDILTDGKPEEDYKYYIDEWKENNREALSIKDGSVPASADDHPEWVGRYEHHAYEECEIRAENGRLYFCYGSLKAVMCVKPDGELCAYPGDITDDETPMAGRIDMKLTENSVSIICAEREDLSCWVTFTK